ncbi:hypothetical protein [Pseudomonas sp. S2_A02]
MADGRNKTPQTGASNRIKHALLLPGWSFSNGSQALLRQTGKPVLVSEYDVEMKGKIFCPECCCPLFRSPEDEDANKRGRSAFFAHKRGIKTECSLRTKPAVGKNYTTEEEANQAIVDGALVVIKGFMQSRPISPDIESSVYDQTKVEDQNGELSEVPISRYRGKKFTVPSVLTSVAGICRKFDSNLYKYYYFPEAQHAQLLVDALRPVTPATDVTEHPVLIHGVITSVGDAGNNPWNVRFVFLKFSSNLGYKDFSLKISVADGDHHGINKSAVGRTVIAYGRVRQSGIGLALNELKWGEVALLPAKYVEILNS